MASELKVKVAPLSLRKALLVGLIIFVFDALILNQGIFSALIALGLILVGLPRILFVKKFAPVRMQRLRNIAIYLVAVTLVFALNSVNNKLAQRRAETLVQAVKAFHAKNQRYPDSLKELVPDYIEKVPLAKYSLMFNNYRYYRSDQGASLFYIEMPPFGRPTFVFSRNQWDYRD